LRGDYWVCIRHRLLTHSSDAYAVRGVSDASGLGLSGPVQLWVNGKAVYDGLGLDELISANGLYARRFLARNTRHGFPQGVATSDKRGKKAQYPMMFDEMTREIADAAAVRRKAVMIHFQVLKNADRLKGMDAVEFCRNVGIEDVWATEFKKMINLAALLAEQGFELALRTE